MSDNAEKDNESDNNRDQMTKNENNGSPATVSSNNKSDEQSSYISEGTIKSDPNRKDSYIFKWSFLLPENKRFRGNWTFRMKMATDSWPSTSGQSKEILEFKAMPVDQTFDFSETYQQRHQQSTSIISTKIAPTDAPETVPDDRTRKIVISNAAPIKLKRRRPLLPNNTFELDVSAGGLVAALKSCLKCTDVWICYLDLNILDFDKVPHNLVSKLLEQNEYVRAMFLRNPSMMRLSLETVPTSKNNETSQPRQDQEKQLYEKAEQDFLTLQATLDHFSKQNFAVDPLVILKMEYKAYYSGISNGLLWPAFHGLPEYIIKEYSGEAGKKRLAEDWCQYKMVNDLFANQAIRTSGQQDFIWIHDYHLLLTGRRIRELDQSLNCGFFLHTPFGMNVQFFENYREQGLAVLDGLLGFTKVGFQTNRDTKQFKNMIEKYLPDAKITGTTTLKIQYQGFSTFVGTFPIGVKTSTILESINVPDIDKIVKTHREKLMKNCKGKLFLSVERFDFTKGIIERLKAIKKYFEIYPHRAGMDIFYQIAASSRSEISSYKAYQQEAMQLSEEINAFVQAKTGKEHLKTVTLDTTNHRQEFVFKLYKVADVIVVTPIMDGMNLVIKEAIICNPKAALILSTGSGAERQLFDANLSHCYIRLQDVTNVEKFADALLESTELSENECINRGKQLNEYTRKFDIDYWISSFLDPSWTQC